MRLRRVIHGAPHRYREATARIELAMTALLEGLRQVDRVPRPRLDDCVVIAAPPAVHQPHPVVGASFQGELVDYAWPLVSTANQPSSKWVA